MGEDCDDTASLGCYTLTLSEDSGGSWESLSGDIAQVHVYSDGVLDSSHTLSPSDGGAVEVELCFDPGAELSLDYEYSGQVGNNLCTDSCAFALNGQCEDASEASFDGVDRCDATTDCTDCGGTVGGQGWNIGQSFTLYDSQGGVLYESGLGPENASDLYSETVAATQGGALFNPDAVEVCDGADNDCDGDVDDDDSDVDSSTMQASYSDVDQDGYGDSSTAVYSCELPINAITVAGDCNDAAVFGSTINPGMSEVCDGIDNDCDGDVDDADADLDVTTANSYYVDSDGDGYGAGDGSILVSLSRGL